MEIDELDPRVMALTLDVMEACGVCGDAAVPKSQRAAASERGMKLIAAAKAMAECRDCSEAEAVALERLAAYFAGDGGA